MVPALDTLESIRVDVIPLEPPRMTEWWALRGSLLVSKMTQHKERAVRQIPKTKPIVSAIRLLSVLTKRSAVLVFAGFMMFLMSGLQGDDAPALPPDVQKIAEKANSAIISVNTSTEAQIAKIKAQEVKDLQRLYDAAVKKGDQAQADAIKQGSEAALPAARLLSASRRRAGVMTADAQSEMEVAQRHRCNGEDEVPDPVRSPMRAW
jgi:hypothetical protein